MITSLLSRQTYAGTGSTGPFGFAFKIFNPATDLKVTKLSALGAETPLAYLADYTVVGIKSGVDSYGAGGTVTLNVALAAGESLTIRRVPPNVQGLSVQNAGPFFPKGYEDQLDYLVMLVQAHEDTLSRVLQMKETTDLTTGVSPALPTPSAGLLLGWDATGKRVVNTPGTPGPAGPSIQTFASAAARNAVFPAPGLNQIVRRSDTGVEERWDQASDTWRPEGVTRAAGPVINVESRGAKGDGVTDDGAALETIDALITAQGYGLLAFDPPTAGVGKTYYINSARTINNNIRSSFPGGVIELGPAAVLTLNGRVEGGGHQIFKNSGGKIVPNGKQDQFRAVWFGIKGDSNGNHLSGTDNGPTLRWMADQLPEAATVRFDLFMKMRIATISGIAGMKQVTWAGPFIGGGDIGQAAAPTFYDDTPYQSAAMLFFVRCSNCMFTALNFMTAIGSGTTRGANALTEFDGLKIATTAGLPGGFPVGWRYVNSDTNKIVAYDGAVWQPIADITASKLGNAISTANQFFYCQWNGDSSNTSLQALSFSRYSDTNDEYHLITKCGFVNFSIGGTSNCDTAGWELAADGGASMDPANPNPKTITFPVGHVTRNGGHLPFFQRFPGERIVISLPTGGTFTTTIATINGDLLSGTVADNPPIAFTNRYTVIGSNVGSAVFIGPSFNAKAIKIRDCIFSGWAKGLQANGGSFHAFNNSMTGQEWNFYVTGNQSEPSSDFMTNTEQSRQHLYIDSQWPHTMMPGRFSADGQLPGSGMLQFAPQSPSMTIIGSNIGVEANNLGAKAFDLTVAGTMYLLLLGCICFGQNRVKMGLTTRHPNCTLEWKGLQNWLIGTAAEEALPRFAIFAGGSEILRTDMSSGITSSLVWTLNDNVPIDAHLPQGGSFMPFFHDAQHKMRWRGTFNDGSLWTYDYQRSGRVVVPIPAAGTDIVPNFQLGTHLYFAMNGAHQINGPAFAIADGDHVTFEIENVTGIGTTFHGVFKLAGAWVDPAAGKKRQITFSYEANSTLFTEVSRTPADI